MANKWLLETVRYARSQMPESMMLQNGDPKIMYPIIFQIFCIRTDSRCIIIDPGCEALDGFDMCFQASPLQALEQIGVKPKDVTDVIITHAHHDHIDAVKYFPHSIIHIQEQEYAAGKSYIPDGYQVQCFSDSEVIVENVIVRMIGDHSIGSCVIELAAEDKTWIISGDECYTRAAFEKKKELECQSDSHGSSKFLSRYTGERYCLLFNHEPTTPTGAIAKYENGE